MKVYLGVRCRLEQSEVDTNTYSHLIGQHHAAPPPGHHFSRCTLRRLLSSIIILPLASLGRSLHPNRHARSIVGSRTEHSERTTKTLGSQPTTTMTRWRRYFQTPSDSEHRTQHRRSLLPRPLSPPPEPHTQTHTPRRTRHERRRRITFSTATSVCLFGPTRTCSYSS